MLQHSSLNDASTPYIFTGGISALFFILAFLVYGPSLSYPFISLDDPYVIYNNLAIRQINFATLKHIFTTYDPELYTPLTFFTFQLNYLWGGLQPFSYHLTNLILHVTNALLVTWLFVLLMKHRALAIFAGLVFLLHPLQTETVVWATARKDVLSSCFFLLSFIHYLRYRETDRRILYLLSIALFLLALLSKVTIFILPALLFLVDFQQKRVVDRKMIVEKIPYILLSCAFVLVGLLPKASILSSTTASEKILMASKTLFFYLWKFIWPRDLSVLYPNFSIISWASPEFILSFLGVLMLGVLVCISLRKTRDICFGFGFFLIAIGPSLLHFNRNAAILSGHATGIQFASDHYMYIPIIGLLFILLLGFDILWKWPVRFHQQKNIRIVLVIFCIMVLVGATVCSSRQAALWQNNEALFLHTLKLYPFSTASRVTLSIIYRKSGRYDEEWKVLEEGLRYGPNSKLYTGLGSIYARREEYAKAMEQYLKAMQTDPNNSEPDFGIGVVLAHQGKIEEALASYDEAIRKDPQYVAAYVNKGSMYLDQGKLDESEANFKKAVSLNASSKEGHYNLGALYEKKENYQEAIGQYRIAQEIDPISLDTYLALAPLYLSLGSNSLAFEQIKYILSKDPDNEVAKNLFQDMVKRGLLGKRKE